MMKTYRYSIFTALFLLWGTVGISQVSASEKRPNVLLVMADDMGWTDIGSFGSEIKTPNLDALAKRGISFTDFHVSVACSPTRSMLLSGHDNHVAGLGNMGELLTENQKGKPGYEGYLNERVVSLAEVLRANDYHTYMAGKWHLGHTQGRLPRDRGFERSFSLLVGGASHWSDMRGIHPKDDPAKYSRDGKELDKLPDDFYSSRSYADFLMDAIRENRSDGKPFLAYLSFTAPHDPVHAPEPWLSKYRGKYDKGYEALKRSRWEAAKKLGIVPKHTQLSGRHPMVEPWDTLSKDRQAIEARGMEVYAGMLEAMDYNYGRVVDFLKDIGEYNNTIIIFLSDNGPNPWYSADYPLARESGFVDEFDNSLKNIGMPGSNYAYGMGFASASAGPLDMFKMTIGEGGIRSPLLISGPGIKGGQRSHSFAYVMDIMPTILELTGSKYPAKYKGRKIEPMRGRSMVNLLNNPKTHIYSSNDFVGGEMVGGKWMRQGDFKAVMLPAPYGVGKWRLFNVVNDPGETKDLSKTMPNKLKTLKTAWDEYAKEVGVVLEN